MFVVYFGSTHYNDPFTLLLRNSQLYPNAEWRTFVCTRKLVVCERHAAPVELSRRQSRPGGRLSISTVPAQLATCRVNKLNSLLHVIVQDGRMFRHKGLFWFVWLVWFALWLQEWATVVGESVGGGKVNFSRTSASHSHHPIFESRFGGECLHAA